MRALKDILHEVGGKYLATTLQEKDARLLISEAYGVGAADLAATERSLHLLVNEGLVLRVRNELLEELLAAVNAETTGEKKHHGTRHAYANMLDARDRVNELGEGPDDEKAKGGGANSQNAPGSTAPGDHAQGEPRRCLEGDGKAGTGRPSPSPYNEELTTLRALLTAVNDYYPPSVEADLTSPRGPRVQRILEARDLANAAAPAEDHIADAGKKVEDPAPPPDRCLWRVVDRPGQGINVEWGSDSDGGPICQMRWTDGLRSDVERAVMGDAESIVRDHNAQIPPTPLERGMDEPSEGEWGDPDMEPVVCIHDVPEDEPCPKCEAMDQDIQDELDSEGHWKDAPPPTGARAQAIEELEKIADDMDDYALAKESTLKEWTAGIRAALTALRSNSSEIPNSSQPEDRVLACGCVRCICSDEDQCHGCGAVMCDFHAKEAQPAAQDGESIRFPDGELHPDPCTWGSLCPYCEIERLQSKVTDLESLLTDQSRQIETLDKDLAGRDQEVDRLHAIRRELQARSPDTARLIEAAVEATEVLVDIVFTDTEVGRAVDHLLFATDPFLKAPAPSDPPAWTREVEAVADEIEKAHIPIYGERDDWAARLRAIAKGEEGEV